ncbi:hypothetical protein [Cohaesibacter sp. ES.047]|uniref:hypothetical protein n=1 Tax=Cohaesibacter sp. ES.047 TaxID=1798205 RepID=UPI000BB95A10|nr:hypothetical protein [Cohaesibacter sp. ES.047]
MRRNSEEIDFAAIGLSHGYVSGMTQGKHCGGIQVDQFVPFAEASKAKVVYAAFGKFAHQDWTTSKSFGEWSLQAGSSKSYIRIERFRSDALPQLGDGRLFMIGSEGTTELMNYTDICGRSDKDHLFLVNDMDQIHMECSDADLHSIGNLAKDVIIRTKVACPHSHTYAAMNLAIRAQTTAEQRGNLAQ